MTNIGKYCGYVADDSSREYCSRAGCQIWDHEKKQCLKKTEVELQEERNTQIAVVISLLKEWLDSQFEREEESVPEVNVFE